MGDRVHVELTPEHATTLKMWAGSGKTEQRMALQARGVLLGAEVLALQKFLNRPA